MSGGPKILLGTTIAIGLVAGCGVPPTPVAGAGDPPNVVLITIDALRADHVGFSAAGAPLTPEIDRVATESVVFHQALASFQSTTASMPSLMTGRYPSFEGVTQWRQDTRYGFADLASGDERGERGLTRNVTTLAEILAERGYATAGFHTNPHLSKANRFDQGFDRYEQFHRHLQRARERRSHSLEASYAPGDVVMESVTQWIALRPNQPFFLWIHFMDPHSPYLPPGSCGGPERPPSPEVSDLALNEALYHLLFTARGAARRAAEYTSSEALALTKENLIERAHALYRNEVRCCDRAVAAIVAALRASGELDRSVFVLTADHGEEFGDHGHIFHERFQLAPEELLRIPLLIRLPRGAAGGTTVGEVSRMVDIAPTVLDVIGLGEAAATMDGRSLRPLWERTHDDPRTAFVSMIEHGVVRTGEWKYRYDKETDVERLFRIDRDPLEVDDVAADHPEVVRRLGDEWRRFSEQLRARGDAPADGDEGPVLDDEQRRRLEALGYTEG